MNITKAFIERNRLKKYIAEQSSTLQMTRIGHPKDEGERSWEDTGGVTFDELLDGVVEAKHYLGEFNKAIDEANSKGPRTLLDELEALKAQEATLDGVLSKARAFRGKEMVSEDGKTFVVERVLDFDLERVKSLSSQVKKDIEDLEDRIAEKNAETEVVLGEPLERFLREYKE